MKKFWTFTGLERALWRTADRMAQVVMTATASTRQPHRFMKVSLKF